MANILIIGESNGDKIKNVTLEILGKLSGQNLDVAFIGAVSDAMTEELTKYGANNIHGLTAEKLENYSPEGYANSFHSFISNNNYDYVFSGSTSVGKDLIPRLAGMFDAGMASEVVSFTMDGDTFSGTRPMFAGKCLAKVQVQGPRPHFITVRPNALGLVDSPSAGQGNKSETTVESGNIRAIIKEVIKGASEKLDLTEANIIVSGGRAMENSENFKILQELADTLNATVGASRAAVDAGYAPHSMQVGQTGKTVSPSLYIACGISGAIQHLAGMRTSKVIVAINTDKDAPIFAKADYGIVGDLFKIVPIMTEEIKKIL